MNRSALKLGTLAAVCLTGVISGCRGQVSENSPIVIIRNMHQQQKYKPQERSAYFQDTRTMRPVPTHTISQEEGVIDMDVESGLSAGTRTYLERIPTSVVTAARFRTNDARWIEGAEALLSRGRERFNIYCTPCHGTSGDGAGIVWARSQGGAYQYPRPATLHDDRVRHAPDGQIYSTIRNGVRNMPSYAAQIPTHDRWAIVAYVRALQLSQATAGATP